MDSRYLQAYLIDFVITHSDLSHPLLQTACGFVAAKSPSDVHPDALSDLAPAALLQVILAQNAPDAPLSVDASLGGLLGEVGLPVWRLSQLPDRDYAPSLSDGRAEATRRLDALRTAVSGLARASQRRQACDSACDVVEGDLQAAAERRRDVLQSVFEFSARARALLDENAQAKSAATRNIIKKVQSADLTSRTANIAFQSPPVSESLAPSSPPQRAPNVWVGLADFVISRAQEEIISSLLSSNAGRYLESPAAQSAFPRTYQLASAIGDQTVSPSLWRTTLAADMRALPGTVLTSDDLAAALFANDPEVLQRLGEARMLYGFGERILDREPPLELIQALPALSVNADGTSRVGPEVRLALHVVARMAEDYASQQVQTWQLAPSDMPNYLLTPENIERGGRLLSVYLRLLLVDALQTREAPLNRAEAAAFPLFLDQLPQVTAQLAGGVRSVERMLQTLRDFESRETVDYGDYVGLILDQTDGVLSLAEALSVSPARTEQFRALRERWSLVSDLYVSSQRNSYSEVLAQTVVLLNRLSADTDLGDGLFESDGFQNLFRTASLGAAVADARDEAQLQSAFRAAALPVGSRRAKREGRGRPLYLNAYLGGGLGFERALATDDRALAASVALPVGIEWSPSWLGPFSLFVPLVDLGAVASYRFQDGDAGESSIGEGFGEVTLQQVLSPGLYLTFGGRSVPLSAGLGVQATPRLRRIGNTPEAPRSDVVRWGAFLAIDVPLFSF